VLIIVAPKIKPSYNISFTMYDSFVDLTDAIVQQNLAQQDLAQHDTIQQDTVQKDTTQQDSTQEDTTKEDTSQQDTSQQDTTQQESPQFKSPLADSSQRMAQRKSRQSQQSRWKSQKTEALDRELVKVRASLAMAHVKLADHSNMLRSILNICEGLAQNATVPLSAAPTTAAPTNAAPNETDIANAVSTDSAPTDDGLPKVGLIGTEAAQTGPDPTDSYTIPVNTDTSTPVNAHKSPAQTEIEENYIRSRPKRRGKQTGSASKRIRAE
jgi:DNA mismatch repair ATPase MutL